MKIRLRSRKNATAKVAGAPAKLLNPLLVFIGIFVLYNLLGLVDVPWNISGSYSKEAPWLMFFTALSALGIVYVVSLVFGRKILPNDKAQGSPSLLGFVLLGVFGLCLAMSIITNGGVALFLGEARFSNSAIVYNLAQMYGLWVLLSTINLIEKGKAIKKLPIAIYIVGITAFGYRSPALVFGIVLGTYFLLYRIPSKKAIKIGSVCGLVFIIASAVMSGFRVSQDYDIEKFFKNIDYQYLAEHPYFTPLVPALAMFDYSQSTVSDVAANLPESKMGDLFLSNYETFLPGQHWGARNIVGDIVGARWVNGRPMSITPTIQGGLYIDFGYVGIFFGMIFVGFMISILYRMSLTGTSRMRFVFAYVFALSVMSIHNGYWDAVFVFFLFFIFLVKVFDVLKHSFPRFSRVPRLAV